MASFGDVAAASASEVACRPCQESKRNKAGNAIETDHAANFDDARLIGVFEHFYDKNRSGKDGYGTHYVVLGYEFKWISASAPKPDDQHSELRWWPVAELLSSDRVHENAKAYFRPRARSRQ